VKKGGCVKPGERYSRPGPDGPRLERGRKTRRSEENKMCLELGGNETQDRGGPRMSLNSNKIRGTAPTDPDYDAAF
jgi:hypothetical protein